VLSILGGVGLLVLYALGGQVQLEGVLLAAALGGIGVALVLWGKHLFPPEIVTEERDPLPSSQEERAALDRALEEEEHEMNRRSFLVRLLVGAAGALGLAAIFPVRSLGPGPGDVLFRTAWRPGFRLVDEGGNAIRANDLQVGGVVTVFPEGHTTAEDSQAILVRVEPGQLRLPPGREAWAPDGNVCYSKICTHAGCPVGLYAAETRQLLCPCHQSAFDVTDGARPVFGPAARPLPQLSLRVDENGYLVANGDFDEPVGPGFWNRGRGSAD
jgi:ubiquinol-cytochrome c reductase iron-sulfur subunit